jgi:hypothetical protein
VVSIDSYVTVLLTVGLCFVAGGLAQRNVPTIAGAACAVIGPLAWLGLLLKVIMMGVGSVAWLRPGTLFTMFAAMVPRLVSRYAGLCHPSSGEVCRRRSGNWVHQTRVCCRKAALRRGQEWVGSTGCSVAHISGPQTVVSEC